MNRFARWCSGLLALCLLLVSCTEPLPEADGPPGEEPSALSSAQVQDFPAQEPSAEEPSPLLEMSVTPELADANGIAVNTGFVLRAPGISDIRELEGHLALSPETPFTLSGGTEDGEFRLQPDDVLEHTLVYRVEALDDAGQRLRSWAFQTRAPLAILATTPQNLGSGVKVTAGIEVMFNRENLDMSDYFFIDPPVEGSFLHYGNRAAFVPGAPLERGTWYTVTIGAGLSHQDGTSLEEDYTFTFLTQAEQREATPASVSFTMSTASAETFLSTDIPVFSTYVNYMKGPQLIGVAAYALSEEDYLTELANRNISGYYRDEDAWTPVDSMTPVLRFSREIQPDSYRERVWDDDGELVGYEVRQENHGFGYLAFPQPLPQGYYLVHFTASDPVTGHVAVRQKPIQVNNTALYYGTYNGTSIAWINDAQTGDALGGTEIHLLDEQGEKTLSTAVTQADGTAFWDNGSTRESGTGILRILRADGPDYLDNVGANALQEETAEQIYISVAYTDRSAYLTTDTIQLWGMVRGRRQDLSPDTALRLELSMGYSYYGYEDDTLITKAVQLEEGGTYSEKFSLEDMHPGYYTLRLLDQEDRVIESLYCYVDDYEKPAYLVSTWSDKPFYLPGEEVDMNLSITYYDGTPVFGLPFSTNVDTYRSSQRPVVYYTPPGEEEEDNEEDVAGEDVAVSLNREDELPSQVYTNDYGTVRAQVVPSAQRGWAPYRFNYSFRSDASYFDNYQYYDHYSDMMYGSAIYFPSTIALRTKLEEGGSALTIMTHAIDTRGIESAGDIFTKEYPENILGAGTDTPLSVTIKKHTYHSTREIDQKVQYYDWAGKEIVITYDYSYSCWNEEEVVAAYDTTTTNGLLVLEDLPRPEEGEENVTYYVTVVTQDDLGTELTQTVALAPGFRPYFPDVEPVVTRSSVRRSYGFIDAASADRETFYWSLKLKEGETADIQLVENQETFDFQGKVFYYFVGEQIEYSGVSQGERFSITQGLYYPSGAVVGAYFDGEHIFQVSSIDVTFDYDDYALEVELATDRDRYGPGDTATITARVTDREGAGVAARVSLSVVDEAALAVSDQKIRPLGKIYGSMYYNYYYQHSATVSYDQHYAYYDYLAAQEDEEEELYDDDDEPADDVEAPVTGGGDGGEPDYVRDSFVDTAQFLLLDTDSDGQMEYSFTLPDNLTSWRVTGVAVATGSVMAGQNERNITTTADLLVHPLFNDSYLEGDDIGLSVTAQGVSTQASTPIRYHLEVRSSQGDEVLLELDTKGRTDSPVHLSLGRLPLGEYIFTLRGSTNDARDTVAYPFSVVGSNLELPVTSRFTLDSSGRPLEISPARYPVLVGFSDQRYGNYLRAAFRLIRQRGDRLDTMVAAIPARQLLEEYLPREEQNLIEHIPGHMRWVDIDGYLDYGRYFYALTPYDSGDVELTARVLALSGAELSSTSSVGYHLSNYTDFADPEEEFSLLPQPEEEPEDAYDPDEAWDDVIDYPFDEPGPELSPDHKAAALMGRAALDHPVLLELQRRLEEPELFTSAGHMYLISGLALLGDQDGAEAHYRELVAPLLQSIGQQKRMPVQGEDNGYRLTAMALMTASLLDHEDASALADWLLDNTSVYYDPAVELALYLGTYRPADSGPSSFTYTKNGRETEVKLGPGEIHMVRFMKEDLESGGIYATSGSVTATASYLGTPEAHLQANPKQEDDFADPVGITREIRPSTLEDLERFGRWDLMESGDLEGYYTVSLEITFARSAPTGQYTVLERVPSSLRSQFYTRMEWEDDENMYYYGYNSHRNVEKQQRTYTIYLEFDPNLETQSQPEATMVLTYLGRQIYAGNSGMEPVLVEHSGSGLSLLIYPEERGSLESTLSADKRAYPEKNISGAGPRQEEADEHA